MTGADATRAVALRRPERHPHDVFVALIRDAASQRRDPGERLDDRGGVSEDEDAPSVRVTRRRLCEARRARRRRGDRALVLDLAARLVPLGREVAASHERVLGRRTPRRIPFNPLDSVGEVPPVGAHLLVVPSVALPEHSAEVPDDGGRIARVLTLHRRNLRRILRLDLREPMLLPIREPGADVNRGDASPRVHLPQHRRRGPHQRSRGPEEVLRPALPRQQQPLDLALDLLAVNLARAVVAHLARLRLVLQVVRRPQLELDVAPSQHLVAVQPLVQPRVVLRGLAAARVLFVAVVRHGVWLDLRRIRVGRPTVLRELARPAVGVLVIFATHVMERSHGRLASEQCVELLFPRRVPTPVEPVAGEVVPGVEVAVLAAVRSPRPGAASPRVNVHRPSDGLAEREERAPPLHVVPEAVIPPTLQHQNPRFILVKLRVSLERGAEARFARGAEPLV